MVIDYGNGGCTCQSFVSSSLDDLKTKVNKPHKYPSSSMTLADGSRYVFVLIAGVGGGLGQAKNSRCL